MSTNNTPSLLDAARAVADDIQRGNIVHSQHCNGEEIRRAKALVADLRAAIAREEARNGPDCIICVGGQTLPDGAVADDDELPICTDCHDAAVERVRGAR